MLSRIKTLFHKGGTAFAKRPLTSFFILLALLLGVILLGHTLRQPAEDAEVKDAKKKETSVFVASQNSAVLTVPARVEKEQVVTVTALSPGVVSRVLVSPGKKVVRGSTLVQLTNDYNSGSNALTVELAEEERRLTLELSDINKKITRLEERSIERSDTLSALEEEIALRTLKRDKAARQSSLETSRLNLEIARRSDAALFPKSFGSGTVENINVRVGDYVAPGTPLATIRLDQGSLMLEALVSKETAELADPNKNASVLLPSQEEKTLFATPIYLSQGEDENGLFSLIYTLSPEAAAMLTDGAFASLQVPLANTRGDALLVPIDVLFQENNRAWVLVERDGRAETKEVSIGRLYGSFARVTGLSREDRIIANRSVIAGDEVTLLSTATSR